MGSEGSEAIVLSDFRHGTYKKLVISEGRLTGAVLVGETGDALWYLDMIRHRASVAAIRSEMMFGRPLSSRPKAA
jgi:nitrite reductase (NADH) large subunit